MASGFITLPNGNNWSSRWTRYDWVLETIMNELKSFGEEKTLKDWLQYILPDENNGDIESGYCFYKANESEESILRIIDTRLMKDNFQLLFWQKVKELSQKLSRETDIGFLINQLNDCYENSLKEPLTAPDDIGLKEIFFVSGFEIGK
jgi:hypothetical protein